MKIHNWFAYPNVKGVEGSGFKLRWMRKF